MVDLSAKLAFFLFVRSLHRFDLNRHPRYFAREARFCFRTYGLNYWSGQIDTDIGCFVCGEDHRLGASDSSLTYLLVIHIQCSHASLGQSAAVIVEFEADC
jgi:hypothetical protein